MQVKSIVTLKEGCTSNWSVLKDLNQVMTGPAPHQYLVVREMIYDPFTQKPIALLFEEYYNKSVYCPAFNRMMELAFSIDYFTEVQPPIALTDLCDVFKKTQS